MLGECTLWACAVQMETVVAAFVKASLFIFLFLLYEK